MQMSIKYSQLFLFLILLALLNQQCSSESISDDPLEQNLRLAGKNRSELEKVLQHYRQRPEDSLQLKAAIFLISNMEGGHYYSSKQFEKYNYIFNEINTKSEADIFKLKDSIINENGFPEKTSLRVNQDLRFLTADYLIQNIDLAFAVWQSAPWHASTSFDLFCNYILPYRNYSEYPDTWRQSLHEKYKEIPSNYKTPDEVCCQFNDDIKKWFRYTNAFNDYPGRISANNLLKGQHGNCSDMAAIATYSARALGVPVAIDYTPQWANYHDGHAWNALIFNEKESVSFLGAEGNPVDYSIVQQAESKSAKVFRKTLAKQAESFASIASGINEKDIPAYLQNSRIIDVTHIYTNVSNLIVTIKNSKEKFIYLCIAKQRTWEAIAGSELNVQGIATFQNMGRNILYMPMFYKNGVYKAAGHPFILDFDGKVQTLDIDVVQKQDVDIKRKFPIKRENMKWGYAEYLHRARLEGAQTPDFKDATTLLTLKEPMEHWGVKDNGGTAVRDRLEYESLWEEAAVSNKKAVRYVRLMLPDSQFLKIGDLEFFAKDATNPLQGTPIGSVSHPEWAFDGVNGYSLIDESPEGAQWVGLDLGKPTSIAKLRYLPACGTNQVTPGKTYELFYWSGKWTSLGIRTATQHTIPFAQVPVNVLFRLHCRDCNDALERPFTYEKNRQVWW